MDGWGEENRCSNELLTSFIPLSGQTNRPTDGEGDGGGSRAWRSDGGQPCRHSTQGPVGSVKSGLITASACSYQLLARKHIPAFPLDHIGFQLCMTPPMLPFVYLITPLVHKRVWKEGSINGL
uniref:Uncharacterized protein n=1 Tax=Mastacembelus armatus TaxID=205130 RepID=A0A3Q3LV84_9TELE